MGVSPACDFCYAETLMDTRYGRVQWGHRKTDFGPPPSVGTRSRTSKAYWRQPHTWNRHHAMFKAKHGHRQRVFCASLSDVFDNQVPTEWQSDLWGTIEQTPELDWLLLTKRPENIRKLIPPSWGREMPDNVWLGTTAEDQKHYDLRWPILRDAPAARVKFISYEPALGPLQLFGEAPYPDWFIAGGESGKNFRSVDSDCFRQVKYGCEYHGIAFFMKQMPGLVPIPDDLMLRQFPRAA